MDTFGALGEAIGVFFVFLNYQVNCACTFICNRPSLDGTRLSVEIIVSFTLCSCRDRNAFIKVARMRTHKSTLERQMAEKNENSKRDIVCEVCMCVSP